MCICSIGVCKSNAIGALNKFLPNRFLKGECFKRRHFRVYSIDHVPQIMLFAVNSIGELLTNTWLFLYV